MKISSGSVVFDNLLEGGYSTGLINTIYGPAASGKTTCCLLATIACHNQGKKIVFIDTENGFDVKRLQQLTPDYENVLESVILLKADSFAEQKKRFEFLQRLFPNPRVGLVIVDTIGAQYRVARKDDIKVINQELAEQVDILRDICKASNTIVLVTNQVYANVKDEDPDSVGMVGGEIIKNRSRNIIQLQVINSNKRKALLEKCDDIEPKEIDFEIKEKGFTPL